MATIFIPPMVSATEDKWAYAFTIQTFQKNSFTDYRYRQTNDVDNKWKVALEWSDEPGGTTITRFWMDKKLTKQRVTGKLDVLEGTYKKENPYFAANKSDVRLTAENNNFNNNTFTVVGYWDEETW